MSRNFDEWLKTFTDNISNYKYFVDYEAIYKNVDLYKVELNMLNALIGSKNIENEFEEILKKYPEVLKCIPILLAVRQHQITVLNDDEEKLEYDFNKMNYSIEQYKVFMRETGLFDLIQNHIVNNIYDYVLGVETGLNANARKNHGGRLMEDIVEKYIRNSGFNKGITYYKDMYLRNIESKWNINISNIDNNSQTKRFDFVVKTEKYIYLIETNYFSSGGSKLSEIARDFKMIAEKTEKIDGIKFVWFTDGNGWNYSKASLKEAFESMHVYNINDIKNGIMKEIFK